MTLIPGTQRPMHAVALALLGLALHSPVRASDPPTAMPPSSLPKQVPSSLAANPAETMAAMAHELDRNGAVVVLMIEKIPITQAEMADVVRTMPVSFANAGFPEVSRRALDVLIGQKAMALNANKEGLDKDPDVVRRESTATERALADAWLTRQTNAAVTDQALHTKYDSDIAGRPGAEEVRARLILVPTEFEARSIIAKAQQGADFAELARTLSKAPNAANGGDLGYAALDALAPEIGPVVFALAPGQMTAYPVNSPIGYFVLRVEGRRQRATPTFEEARPKLEGALRAEAASTMIQAVLAHIKVVRVTNPGDAPAK